MPRKVSDDEHLQAAMVALELAASNRPWCAPAVNRRASLQWHVLMCWQMLSASKELVNSPNSERAGACSTSTAPTTSYSRGWDSMTPRQRQFTHSDTSPNV
jgi:hypothetical protein